MLNGPELRQATRDDAGAMLALLQSVCAEGDALPFIDGVDQRMIESQWLGATACVLACDSDGLLGMYRYGPNMPGRGAHVATATFLVSQEARGRGIGHALVAHCMAAAKAAGFRAMQFNQVLSSNTAALALYRRMGFMEVMVHCQSFPAATSWRASNSVRLASQRSSAMSHSHISANAPPISSIPRQSVT